jgi:peptidoglycan/LPS O-acetylase OafA/YrhL
MYIIFGKIIVFLCFIYYLLASRSDDPFYRKLYILFGVMLFEFVVGIMHALYNNNIINVREILHKGIYIGLFAVTGYGLFQDFDLTSNYVLSIFITMFIALGYFVDDFLLKTSPTVNDCLNDIIYRN